jgi:glycosyltransferase involved in cell wall biosynthesis
MLEPWALRYRAWKKKVAWITYQRGDLASASGFCATSDDEAANIRALGFSQPISIIPNGIEIPEWQEPIPRDGPERTVLFLSRIHPKKGLLDLIRAWTIVRPPHWRVVIAGPDELGHKTEVVRAVEQAGLSDVISFHEAVDGTAKLALYRRADLFVLPTYSENFGLVIAEALACGVPVITTRGAPWEGLRRHRCGWWIEIGHEALAITLREAVAMADGERVAMGRRGRAWVERAFAWSEIVGQMTDYYHWLLHGGDRPACVSAC